MKIKGKIITLTGMHIGGYKDSFKIGGVDSPVIKDKDGFPYIPGSSLKGKIRSLLELKYGIVNSDNNLDLAKWNTNNEDEKKIAFVFGPADNDRETPIVVVFRDVYVPEEVKNRYKDLDKEKVEESFYELKSENKINRKTGKTEGGLRTIERVVPGVEFEAEIVIHDYLFNNKGEYVTKDGKFKITLKEVLELLKEGFQLLADDYLGGSGTRGYGKVDVSEVIEAINKEIKELDKEENQSFVN